MSTDAPDILREGVNAALQRLTDQIADAARRGDLSRAKELDKMATEVERILAERDNFEGRSRRPARGSADDSSQLRA